MLRIPLAIILTFWFIFMLTIAGLFILQGAGCILFDTPIVTHCGGEWAGGLFDGNH